ncbi:hypothetical protein IU440_10205 [Nocardia cyriacigeorgica]|uniref:hypothetical protein n=1 Tax=Nocardia cyriacigeorgica TaxID=135487 RepID=UPI001895E6DB|nr:hypothetical protein [Nocardia cyriacigeorgica]MBF6425053.1 hypothetical protein [Nocardia cyriacigeorgica]
MTIQNEGSKITDAVKEKPEGFSHSEIVDAFNPLAPGDNAQRAADQLGDIAAKWTDGVTVFAARIRRSSAAAWDGPAAEKSREAIGNYATRAEDFTDALNALAVRVDDTVTAILRTQRNLPAEIEKKSGWDPRSWPYVGSHNQDKRDDAESTARQVMNDHYVTPFVLADSQIPVLPVPVSPTAPLHGPIEPGEVKPGGENGGGGGTGGGGTGSGGGTGGGTGGTGEPEEPTEEGTGEETPEQQGSGEDQSSWGDDSTAGQDTTPSAATTPAGAETPSTVPSSTTPTGTFPGSSGGTGTGIGTGGGAGGTGGGVGGGVAAPGRSIPGMPGTGAVPGMGAAGPAGAAAAAAGRAGMPGMMSPGAAGRGQQGQDDEQHKLPDYLINAENAAELLGEQPRTVPGGVIGGDVPSARPSEQSG